MKKELSDKMDNVITAVDSFTKKVEKVEQEQVANLGAHDRFKEHITKLEHQPEGGVA